MNPSIDILNQTFESLTVKTRAGSAPDGSAVWQCQCKCGKFIKVVSSDLRFGHTQSCGCTRKNLDRFIRPVAYGMLHSAKSRAKGYGLPFSITIDDIVVPLICPILGIPLELGKKQVQDSSPSLDRVYPEKGYVRGNVLVVSHKANRLKNELSPEGLIDLGKQFRKLWRSLQ